MGLMALANGAPSRRYSRSKYSPPTQVGEVLLSELLASCGRPGLLSKQMELLGRNQSSDDVVLYFAGDLSLLHRPSVAIVGARDVSDAGAARARRLAREMSDAKVTVVSGLAKGVDTNAHEAAIAAGGSTVAVIGTPLSQAYPAENARLQEVIAAQHLLVSPFPEGTRVFPSSFPKRNRVMAALSDATIIVEASDTSGSLYQAAECQRLGRWLFILKSVVDNKWLEWPAKFASYPRTRVVSTAEDILNVLVS